MLRATAVILGLSAACAIPVLNANARTESGTRWAVLIAGSSGYMNYRHQADISHAYTLLTKDGGVAPENVITFMVDDIAQSRENPFKGTLINKPNGPNVYPGSDKIDYKGKDVTPKNFLNALTGGKSELYSMNVSSGAKVLQSGPNDDVFVFFADHGAPGLIAFPDINPLRQSRLLAKQLQDAIATMAENKMFKQLVFYLESCESGSMFDKVLKTPNVYAVTASSPKESSYATYYDKKRQTYLGDLFSVSWMEDSDSATSSETLADQFTRVKKATNKSTVEKYGDTSIADELVDEWSAAGTPSLAADVPAPVRDSVSSRDVVLEVLTNRLETAIEVQQATNTDAQSATQAVDAARSALVAEKARRADSTQRVHALVRRVASASEVTSLLGETGTIEQWDCYEQGLFEYESTCGRFDDYSLRFAGVFANMCEAGHTAERIGKAAREVCGAL